MTRPGGGSAAVVPGGLVARVPARLPPATHCPPHQSLPNLRCSYSWVYTLVLPNSVFIYWGWPTEAAEYGNQRSASRALPLSLFCTAERATGQLAACPLTAPLCLPPSLS